MTDQTDALASILRPLRAGVSVNAGDRPAVRGEIGVLKVSCVNDGKFVPSENKAVLDEKEIARLTESIHGNDILITRANTSELVGQAASCDEPRPDLFLSDKLWRTGIRDEARDDRDWVLAALSSPEARTTIRARATGTSASMKNISQAAFLDIRIPRPAFQVQQKGGDVIRVINILDAVIAKLLAKKRIFRYHVAEVLLCGSKKLSSSSLKSEWRTRSFGEFFEQFSEQNGSHRRPHLTCSKVSGIVLQEDKFARRPITANTLRHKVVRRGDLVVDRMLLWDASLAFVECVAEGIVSPDYSTFHFDEAQGSREFFKALLKSSRLRHTYKTLARGSNTRRRRSSPLDFLSIELPLPEIEEQLKIGELVQGLDHEIETLQRRREYLRLQRTLVLRQLMEHRVS